MVGHSLGGSVAAKVSKLIEDGDNQHLRNLLVGLIVIDVVEGSAIEALPYMKDFLKSRPSGFNNIDEVLQYI